MVSRFYRWRKAGIRQYVFATLQEQADAEGKLDWDKHYVDGTVIRAHQHAAGGHALPVDIRVPSVGSTGKFRLRATSIMLRINS